MAARQLGRVLATSGVTVVYGGGGVGLMGALADGALEAGGRVIGVMPRQLVDAEIAHPGLTHLIEVDSMHERKATMADLADAFCALPGGAGTCDEFFEVWTWQQLGLHAKPVALLDVEGFWRPLRTLLESLVSHGYLRSVDLEALIRVQGAEHLLERLETWQPPDAKWQNDRPPPVLESVAWIHIRDGRLLTARSRGRDVYYLPGGKLEPDESRVDALRREIQEELGLDLDPLTITPLTVIHAPAHGAPGLRLRMHCYTAAAFGQPSPANEISEIRWLVDPYDPQCAPAVSQLLRYLGPDLRE
jgi:uncharacterized protein (TIGR00730 family)